MSGLSWWDRVTGWIADRLPHAFYGPSAIGRWLSAHANMEGITLLLWTFLSVPLAIVERRVFRHERTHSVQWLRWMLAVAIATHIAGWTWWSIVIATVVVFPARYHGELWARALWKIITTSMALGDALHAAYDKHSLEQEARRVAGEPVR